MGSALKGHYVIKMPDIGEGIAEVELIGWKVELGGTVKRWWKSHRPYLAPCCALAASRVK